MVVNDFDEDVDVLVALVGTASNEHFECLLLARSHALGNWSKHNVRTAALYKYILHSILTIIVQQLQLHLFHLITIHFFI